MHSCVLAKLSLLEVYTLSPVFQVVLVTSEVATVTLDREAEIKPMRRSWNHL